MLLDKGLGGLMYTNQLLSGKWVLRVLRAVCGPPVDHLFPDRIMSVWLVFLTNQELSLLKGLGVLQLAGGSDWWQNFPSTECVPLWPSGP